MCCLPLKCLKAVALFQGFMTFLLAIFSFVAAYYVQKLMDSINKQLGDLELLLSFLTSRYITKPFWFLSFAILVASISGVLGTLLKQKKFFLVIQNAANLCFFLCFCLLGLIAILLGNSITENHTCEPSDTQYTNIQQIYQEASKNLCKSSCQCYYTKEITPKVQTEVLFYSSTDKSKAKQAQECIYFQQFDLVQANAIEWMENKFDCSGWCTEYPIKMFDDVSSEVRDENYSCYKAVGNYFKTIFTISGKVFVFAGMYMGIMFVLTCCLGYHPENVHQFSNYRKIGNTVQ